MSQEKELDRPRGWQNLIGGRALHLDPIDPEEIFIEDIAHALGNICRWGGHVEEFYSVAQHCVLASRLTDAKFALVALMHDASEAYMGDMIRPLKRIMPAFEVYEEKLMFAISVRFGFEWPMPPEVALADNQLLCHEHRTMRGKVNPALWDPHPDVPIDLPEIHPWSPTFAKKQFLKRFRELTEARTQTDIFEEMERERQRVMALPILGPDKPKYIIHICACGHESKYHDNDWASGPCKFCSCQAFDLKVTVG